MIRRIYVEKKKGCDVEAKNLKHDIKHNLLIQNLEQLRVLNRYDIDGIDDKQYEIAKTTIFSEPPVDMIFEEEINIDNDEVIFAVEYLPGQYDQRADSAMQCVQIITQQNKPLIAVAKVYILKGKLTDDEIKKIKNYCINPVDSREASLEKPKSIQMEMNIPKEIETLNGFISKSDDEIKALRNNLNLAMSYEDLKFCRDYFRDTEHREPTITEIRVIDTYWSDHCRHTTFLTSIQNVTIDDGHYTKAIKDAYNMYLEQRNELYVGKNKDICLMDIATIAAKALKKQGKLNDLDESEEINACSIVVKVDVDGKQEDWLVMFKNETHNHPTEIEPFGGAATCLGGAIRDPLSGRSYVYQAMRVTGSGDPRTDIKDTLAGKLPQKKITREAAHGYSSYGNQIGLATGQVTEIYDEGFVAKRMEIGAVIAAAPKENVIRKRPQAGDVIVLLGGRTGRDGIGGATGSSKEHTEESILSCGAEVQKGNPPTERKLQRLFRNSDVSKMIKRCNDFGAGGVSVAIGELAEGLDIDLDKVPKKYEGLDGTELAISESQERMAVVIDKNDIDKFIDYSNEENLEATVVAVVTDTKRLKMNWQNKTIVNISRQFLDTNGAKQYANVHIQEPQDIKFFTSVPKLKINENLKQAWLENLQNLNVCSQKGLGQYFDSTIGANTVLMPFGGKNQLTPIEAMAAKIPVQNGSTNTATLMSYGYNPSLSKWSPFHGAIYAVIESVAKIVATGGNHKNIKLTFQEYFERLEKDEYKWGKPFAALLGAFYAQMKIGIAAIGGKDSMSGTFKDLSVPPTLVSFAVDLVDANNILTNEFDKENRQVVYVELPRDEYDLPDFNILDKLYTRIEQLVKDEYLFGISTVKTGGIAEAVTKSCFGNNYGIKFNDDIELENLFKPNYGSFVFEICRKHDISKLFEGFNYKHLGWTQAEAVIEINGIKIQLSDALEAWTSPLEKIFHTQMEVEQKPDANIKLYTLNHQIKSKSIAIPRVFIPVFPGTNCEYDSQRKFEEAGAKVNTFVINNLTANGLEQSIEKAAQIIRNSQIIMFPGGFSAGDEPDGSGKFIAAFFRNPILKEEIMKLLNERDGLILGICNGFQVLIKLGLLPYGDIKDIDSSSPTLTFNTIGHHMSCLVNTKIISNKSPWLMNVNAGDIHTIPISHGEGRFIVEKETMQSLIENGQIATQYVDLNGNPSYDTKYNPNGSMYAVEGITSCDGRVFGKMGHSERIGDNVYKNVSGQKDQKIFEAGVNYFK